MDDDLTFYQRDESGARFFRMPTYGTEEMIKQIVDNLDHYVIVGLADKFMSQHLPRKYKECSRFNDLHGYNRDLFPQPWPEFRLKHGEEHDFQLQCLTRGYKTLVMTEYSKVNRTYAAGGCSDYRTKEFMMHELERLAELWPGLVSLTPDPEHKQGYRFRYNWKEAARRGGIDCG